MLELIVAFLAGWFVEKLKRFADAILDFIWGLMRLIWWLMRLTPPLRCYYFSCLYCVILDEVGGLIDSGRVDGDVARVLRRMILWPHPRLKAWQSRVRFVEPGKPAS